MACPRRQAKCHRGAEGHWRGNRGGILVDRERCFLQTLVRRGRSRERFCTLEPVRGPWGGKSRMQGDY